MSYLTDSAGQQLVNLTHLVHDEPAGVIHINALPYYYQANSKCDGSRQRGRAYSLESLPLFVPARKKATVEPLSACAISEPIVGARSHFSNPLLTGFVLSVLLEHCTKGC